MATATAPPPIDPLDHLALVGSVAKKYLGRGLDYEDLKGWGMVGLMQAVANYEPERGTQFSTCAVPWIMMQIRRAIDRWHRPGAFAHGCTGEDGDYLMASVVDAFGEDDSHEHPHLCDLLAAVDRLPGREATVLRRRFGLGCPHEAQATIGRSLGISRERVREIENRGLRRLRERFGVDWRKAS